jgi:hypothetical protein
MTDQSANNPNSQEPLDRWEEHRNRREARRANRPGGRWVGGAILIVLGIFLLMQNQGVRLWSNWWAVFILIPAVGAFANAWRNFQVAGNRLTTQVRGALFGGMLLLLTSAMFFFNWNVFIFGPILLIMAGVGFLINGVIPD